MAKRLPVDLLEQVQAALRDHPAGLALRELEARLTGVASRRSLQRKLNGWQRKGLVRAVGIRRGRRYLLASPLGPAAATAASARAFGLCLAIALTLSCAASGDKADDAKAATHAIRQQIAKYTAALDGADIDLASQIWRTSAEVSFIHPAGHARGWEEVKGIYKFFGSSFSERKLTVRDVSVHVNGNTAWVEFYWHFVAKQISSTARDTTITLPVTWAPTRGRATTLLPAT